MCVRNALGYMKLHSAIIFVGKNPIPIWHFTLTFPFRMGFSHFIDAISIFDSPLQNGCCYFPPLLWPWLLHNVFQFVFFYMRYANYEYLVYFFLHKYIFEPLASLSASMAETLPNKIQKRKRKFVEIETENVFGKIEFSVTMIGARVNH